MENSSTINSKLINTQIIDEVSLNRIGNIIKNEFDLTEDENKAFELLQIAYKWNIPQLGQMLDTYSLEDLKWISL